jgi:hypothetical protein
MCEEWGVTADVCSEVERAVGTRWLNDWTAVAEIADALTARLVSYSQLEAVIAELVASLRVLENLGDHVEESLRGSAVAQQSLRHGLRTLARRYPGLPQLGNALISSIEKVREARTDGAPESKRTVSYDVVVRMASAAALAIPATECDEFHQALDTLIGLTGDALMFDRVSPYFALRA